MAIRDTVLDENFISSDAGNGWAACYRLVNGKVKQHGIPHARARVTGARLKSDLGSPEHRRVRRLHGSALRLRRRHLEPDRCPD